MPSVNAKCVSVAAAKTLTYRELLTLARERLGPGATALKTREELLSALGLESAELPGEKSANTELVTSDFFVLRKKSGAKN